MPLRFVTIAPRPSVLQAAGRDSEDFQDPDTDMPASAVESFPYIGPAVFASWAEEPDAKHDQARPGSYQTGRQRLRRLNPTDPITGPFMISVRHWRYQHLMVFYLAT